MGREIAPQIKTFTPSALSSMALDAGSEVDIFKSDL